MDELIIQVLAGIIVLVLSASAGFLFRSRMIQESFVLPKGRRATDTQSYAHLNGKWHLYWLSYAPSNPSEPVWMHGLQELQVEKNLVRGKTQFVEHPMLSTYSTLRGEIRSGRMIVLDLYSGDETEFASVIYPNLRSGKLLVGIWNGLDNLLRPIAAPAILIRDEADAQKLNKVLKDSTMSLIPIGEYRIHKDIDK